MTEADFYFTDDGTPRSERFGDIYYSPQDGLAESRTVFLEGCHLRQSWAGPRAEGRDFTVLELGFGTGLNIAAAVQLWIRSGCPGNLHVFTVEAFVIARDQAATALANWPELAEFAQALTAQWPANRRGFHHMDFPQWRVSVTVALMEVEAALDAWEGQADAVFLDGFSPAVNPDMWSPAVFARIAAHTRPGARLATFTVAGHVRRGLQAAGFTVAKCPGYGRKRERLEAVFIGECQSPSPRPRRIAIAGAGIAGACLAWQAGLFGVEADIFDPAPGSGASGNPAALVTPRLDAGDNPISALFADAFAYAVGFYGRLAPQAVIGRGVWQCALDDREQARFGRISQQAGFAAGDLVPFGAGELPDAPDLGGLQITPALYVSPAELLGVLMAGRPIVRTPLPDDLSGYDAVVLACGDGILDRPDVALPLQPVRGQIESAAEDMDRAMAWGGYAVPQAAGMLFGATHDRGDRGTDVRRASSEANLANLARLLPDRAAALRDVELVSRASVRVTSRDHLPVLGPVVDPRLGEVTPAIHVLTGLGSRGFCLAPLLAKAVLANLTGLAPPLTAAAARLLRPGRFVGP
ncbi:tRNA (5-methylaminomethyl-2-thiouridine)(34)-methyltransferase MnmD [Asticcacaulis sp. AC402]|uniref:tRNA (5-methylaminomethyl-2-thiouridine)(34)-methyltransferase MnmD n=1 Tax=Asticcacaulis sp. AC402 TaxID=1282361 RepID=UPI0003C3F655|nr:tRNA (5-methylaminomethyl-2-thiouridine)(34)-methyltransferase MnmD [Asticcacaulis sp. AC402]ESQ76331.1 hypothetical protein ABAC402_04330 [Asticcacaulis sp. AC402]